MIVAIFPLLIVRILPFFSLLLLLLQFFLWLCSSQYLLQEQFVSLFSLASHSGLSKFRSPQKNCLYQVEKNIFFSRYFIEILIYLGLRSKSRPDLKEQCAVWYSGVMRGAVAFALVRARKIRKKNDLSPLSLSPCVEKRKEEEKNLIKS